jgi:protein-S-isoprenylcysteine O-methyltransferase Ste14
VILKRLLLDILFWAAANTLLLLAVKDATFFFRDPRGEVLLVVLNILWLIPVVGDVYVRRDKIKVCAKEYCYYLTMVVLLLEFAGSAFEYTRLRVENHITRIETVAGLFVIGVGFLVSIIGWLSIRRFAAPRFQIVEGHRVVDRGLYRFIRHPIWLSFFLIAFGVPLLLRSAVGMADFIIIVTPSWLYVIRQEEEFLLSMLGNDYRMYLGRTRRLIPFVY